MLELGGRLLGKLWRGSGKLRRGFGASLRAPARTLVHSRADWRGGVEAGTGPGAGAARSGHYRPRSGPAFRPMLGGTGRGRFQDCARYVRPYQTVDGSRRIARVGV